MKGSALNSMVDFPNTLRLFLFYACDQFHEFLTFSRPLVFSRSARGKPSSGVAGRISRIPYVVSYTRYTNTTDTPVTSPTSARVTPPLDIPESVGDSMVEYARIVY